MLITLYFVFLTVPGPPKNLKLNITDEGISLIWDQPEAANGQLTQYKISASVSETYSSIPLPGQSWTYPAVTLRISMLGLAPATQYNVTLCAFNGFGAGPPAQLLLWTPIGGNIMFIWNKHNRKQHLTFHKQTFSRFSFFLTADFKFMLAEKIQNSVKNEYQHETNTVLMRVY